MDDARPRRGLTTARTVLHVLAHLEAHPEGVRADEVAHVVDKSASTAYYLLASLVDEGFATHEGGLYRPCRAAAAPAAAAGRDPLEDAVDDLFLRTHKRCYLGVVRHGGIEITVVRGRQGIARMPGLGTRITGNAHALAMGKVVLARAPADALERYLTAGLKRFTPDTITEPDVLRADLRRVRRTGIAVDREEIAPDFCCIAAPVLDEDRRFLGVIGISMSVRAFDEERPALQETLRDIVGFQACADRREVLDPPHTAGLASSAEHLAVKRRVRQRR